MNPLISIIVPVYNVEEYLDRCVESIVNQIYTNIEIILVDDGSPDNCPKMCDEWAEKDNRIKVIHKENGGVSSARNIGIDNADGDYISFVDSDDYVENNFISSLLSGCQNNEAQLSVCGCCINDNDKVIKAESTVLVNSYDACIMLFDYGNCHYFEGYSCNKLYKKDIIKDNCLKFDTSFKMCEDTLFNFNYIKCINNVCVLDEALYHYCSRKDSAARSKKIQNYFDLLLLINRFIEEASDAELINTIIFWSFRFWIRVVDNFIVNKTGKDYYKITVSKIKEYYHTIMHSKRFPFSIKWRAFIIKYFLFFYKLYIRIKYLKKEY